MIMVKINGEILHTRVNRYFLLKISRKEGIRLLICHMGPFPAMGAGRYDFFMGDYETLNG
jgi:hypothetical protein